MARKQVSDALDPGVQVVNDPSRGTHAQRRHHQVRWAI